VAKKLAGLKLKLSNPKKWTYFSSFLKPVAVSYNVMHHVMHFDEKRGLCHVMHYVMEKDGSDKILHYVMHYVMRVMHRVMYYAMHYVMHDGAKKRAILTSL
jgi:hypothetical protein